MIILGVTVTDSSCGS